MQSVVTKSAEALGRSGKKILRSIYIEARCFPPYCTRDEEGAQKTNQFANWTNIATGIQSAGKIGYAPGCAGLKCTYDFVCSNN